MLDNSSTGGGFLGEGGFGANLESAADTEDTVVGLLGGKTLDGLLDVLTLLGDQVVEPRWIAVSL